MSRLVVLDTNVVVSAGLNPQGAPARIVQAVLRRELAIVLCPVVVGEWMEVLGRRKFVGRGFPPEWAERLVDLAIRLPDPQPWPIPGPDPDDLVFLALAKAAGAVLVTGNIGHYPPEIREGVIVRKPSEFIEKL